MGVGERIKSRRNELGLTQTDLATRMGYTNKTSICKVESGRDNITAERVTKFAKALNCSESYLMGWDETPTTFVPEFESDHIELIELYAKLTLEQKKTVMNLLRSFAPQI